MLLTPLPITTLEIEFRREYHGEPSHEKFGIAPVPIMCNVPSGQSVHVMVGVTLPLAEGLGQGLPETATFTVATLERTDVAPVERTSQK